MRVTRILDRLLAPCKESVHKKTLQAIVRFCEATSRKRKRTMTMTMTRFRSRKSELAGRLLHRLWLMNSSSWPYSWPWPWP